MQYTIRRISRPLDAAVRERAERTGKSLNEAALDAMAEGLGLAGAPLRRRDLGDVAGTWKPDRGLEAALADQDRIDDEIWK